MDNTQLILNRYRPISELGSGGFATVFLAFDTRILRRVAIKCIEINPEHAYFLKNDPSLVDKIPGLQEARTAAMLNDPSIVGVIDFELQNNIAYIIMEYVQGITLSDLLKDAAEPLDLDIVSAIFTSVAHALCVAHSNQVLHLDIKPDNIIIDYQGRVKVSDFGLASLSGTNGFSSAEGGTIGYMPLEQMQQRQLDDRCDEWSLASITYEMLNGTNPFIANDLKSAMLAISNSSVILTSYIRDDVDPQIDEALF